MSKSKVISVFEHEKLTLRSNPKVSEKELEQLEKYHGANGTPYFSLIHNGVKFNQYTGVIQVGNTTIEVLPKIDRTKKDKNIWRDVLIQMLRITSGIEASSTSKSDLRLQHNSIFDLYIEFFIKECEKLTHQGLSKKYRKVKENQTALKGRLHIPNQIRDNIIHKERFHVEYSKYDFNHLINQILKKTLVVLSQIPIRSDLRSRVKSQLLYFEQIGDCVVHKKMFNQIYLNRKTERYTEALEISRLILLNYHPDISKGRNHILALMFDMNQLWERFVTKMLKRHLSENYTVKAQSNKVFWMSENSRKRLKPDILLIPKTETRRKIVIDTKWKTPARNIPSDNDLRQIFAYNRLFESKYGVLLYPGPDKYVMGKYQTEQGEQCTLKYMSILDSNGRLKKQEDLSFSMMDL
jgi:5-methylcytosine-specific restriction enzyme subunit McrC